ncbi:MAG: TonB-dependent receptor [Rhodanobacter sp.]|nr:MAG: TonB-dependent receptor [Rhodanobacter sp.]TAM12046.1 MAG: TonB-dependent receptor [Rhodanobacter sp.]TAM34613.1 MAG: TonB-dependent receptor [Rhodanobacter sp.]
MSVRVSTLALAVACALGTSPLLRAQDAAPARATNLQTVVVTGTRAMDRTVGDSLAPIDVLTPSDLAATGASDLPSALNVLLPSFNFPQATLSDATDATLPAQLRGLSPDQTLVLIDGKRQHPTAVLNNVEVMGRGSSPVDLSAIPLNAIERIEVLRDGAAAQYGSDAIAGVINIILKKGPEHGSVNVTRGMWAGRQGGTWNGGADAGFKLGAGWLRIAANYQNADPTNHAGVDWLLPGDPSYGRVDFHYGMPKKIAKQTAINGEYPLGEHATLYVASLFNQRKVNSPGFFRWLAQYQGSSPTAAAVYPDGYLPVENSAIRDDSSQLGVRGEFAGWHYDIGAATGGNHWKLHTSNTFNYALGADSPTAFYIGTLTLRQNQLSADFDRDFDMPWQHALSVAWGLIAREETFAIKPGDPASYAGAGAQVFPGYRPEDAGSHSRHNQAGYVDLETDFTDKLSAGLAVRREHYSDFGNTDSWKLSGRYAITPMLAVRATASTGFRAPSLQQEYYSDTAIDIINASSGHQSLTTVRTFPVSDPAAIALGAQPLKPERSRNYSVGFVFTPGFGPYATLDFYQVDINDRIILSEDLTGPAVENYLTSVGIPFVSGGRFFTNAVNTRTRGVDLVATWPLTLATGTLKFTGGYNHNKTDIRHVRPNPPQLGLAGLELPVIGREEAGIITVGSPHNKAFLAATWTQGTWTLRAQATRYGAFTFVVPVLPGDQTYAARTLTDVSAAYTLADWTLTLGANNLFNVYPEHSTPTNNFYGLLPYPEGSPFGFSGRYWYANLAYRW